MCPKYDILIVEDEQVVINSIKKILIPEGFTIDETYNVEGALEKLGQYKYKIILTDLMLSKISGLKLVELVSKKYLEIPIIMITGYATLENAVQSLKIGAFDFIPKPFAIEELSGVVHRAIKFAEMKRSLKKHGKLIKQLYKQPYKVDNFKEYYFLGQVSWATLDRDGFAKLGVGETFSGIIGEIERVDFPLINEIIHQGSIFARIFTKEQLLHTIWAPLSGKVIKNNCKINENVELINKDPFLDGWLICIAPTVLEEELVNLTLYK